jgi:4-hydroxy-tetrahydrodipicolinate reductase
VRAVKPPLRVIAFGLGAIGQAAAQLVRRRPSLRLVGAVDLHPATTARGLHCIAGRTLAAVLRQTRADAVIHCTGSDFSAVYPQLAEIVKAGLHCVTSCEEALYPWHRHPQLAAKLDRLCRQHGVAVLGTGVNPGFVMDTLALTATSACQAVTSIKVLRVVDAATRRAALQAKVGVGLTPAEFRRLAATGRIRHVGLTESLVFLAAGLGWQLERVTESIRPVLARRPLRTQFRAAKAGQVAGVRQVARGWRARREVLRLELQMYAGAEAPRDEIQIAGQPPLRVVVPGGTPGDIATPALLVNSLARLPGARPGLHTMATLPVPRVGA